MHFEILVEDQSGKKALDLLVPKIVGAEADFRVIAYKGIGHLPKGLKPGSDAKKRILLDQIPRLLRGHGKTFAGYPPDYPAAVIVVCDLDKRNLKEFRAELLAVLEACQTRPETRFCFAIEEGEAWLLGDIPAIRSAYPQAKKEVLHRYQNDSIGNTWERLADAAVYPGGSSALAAKGWSGIGAAKSQWAAKICPHMDVENNASPSFVYFRDRLRELAKRQGRVDG